MKKQYFISMLVLCAITVNSQSCLPEGITFTTQHQIDKFQVDYPGCTEIEGDVEIGQYGGSDIVNLRGLSVLTSIWGDLSIINNDTLASLTGLDNVTSVGGDLYIRDNSALKSLTGLENVSSLGDNLHIAYNEALTSLAGLGGITSIGGAIYIAVNNTLTSLTGLEGITSIGGNLYIDGNDALISLSGLDEVTSIGGNLGIDHNDALTSLIGLDGVISIGGSLKIDGNDALISLSGLEGVKVVGEYFKIIDNDELKSLTGLEGLTSIGYGLIKILGNDALKSLSGLDNIDEGSINDLNIYNNISLSNCEVVWLCDYLASPNGSVNIFQNASGCQNPAEIANSCGITLPCLPYGNYYFYSQADIDNFYKNYPNCTELEGNVKILGNDINDLNGLNQVTSISGKLEIGNGWVIQNNSLSDFIGLENLTSVGGNLAIIFNAALSSLTGLEGLTSIEGSLSIGINHGLTNLNGLHNVSTIGQDISIYNNASLSSLAGLDYIDPGSISYLYFVENFSLSVCEVESICAYLSSNGQADIYDNTIGCNSPQEVLDSCEANAIKIDERQIKDNIVLYPNPATSKLNISLEGYIIREVMIYTLTGQKVFNIRPKGNTIDISTLQPGMYMVELTVGSRKIRQKLIVEK